MYTEVLQKLFGLIEKQVERTTPEDGSGVPQRVSRIPDMILFADEI
jgi:hypothetical protein